MNVMRYQLIQVRYEGVYCYVIFFSFIRFVMSFASSFIWLGLLV